MSEIAGVQTLKSGLRVPDSALRARASTSCCMDEERSSKDAIQSRIRSMMERVLDRVLRQDPFDVEEHRRQKPIYAALVPDEIFKGSHFERRFVTPFGRIWEVLACDVALAAGYTPVTQFTCTGSIKQERLTRIAEVLRALEHGDRKARRRPNWTEELAYILEGDGPEIQITVVADLVVQKPSAVYAFELKAPLPNSDQTKVSKEKMLKLFCMHPRPFDGAYFALPYNPYGNREDYRWSFPQRWFDMRTDEVVLIGDEFWDMVGVAGTYQALVETIRELGYDYRDRIYREYLQMEPPEIDEE
jgi:hypothetical protein